VENRKPTSNNNIIYEFYNFGHRQLIRYFDATTKLWRLGAIKIVEYIAYNLKYVMVIEVLFLVRRGTWKNNEFKFIPVHTEENLEIIIQQYTCERNNEARSCHLCYSGKAINIGYSEHVFVALVIQIQSACILLYCPL